MIRLVFFFGVVAKIVSGAEHELEVNNGMGKYKQLQVNQTLELTCKNILNRDPPSWTYSSRLHNDPRMKLSQYVGESSLVISNAQVEDAGQYRCSIDHEYNGKTFHFNRTIEVMVNEIRDVKVEEEKDSTKLLCDVHAYPSATVTWKIDFDNEELNPQPEEPDVDYEDDYPLPTSEDLKFVVDKSEGRWTLRQYKGVNNAELIIANVTNNDNGKYYCFAKSIAGDQYKECNVRVTREAAEAGSKSVKNVNAANLEENHPGEKRAGLGGGLIAVIVLSSIVGLGCVIGAAIVLWRIKFPKKKEEGIEQRQECHPLALTNNMGASTA